AKLGDERGCDATEDDAIAVIDTRELSAGFLVHRTATILAGGLLPRRLCPGREQIEGVAPHARQSRRMRKPPKGGEIGRRLEAFGVECRQGLELVYQLQCLRLGGLCRDPAPEIGDGVNEIDVGPALEIGGRGPRAAMFEPKVGERL